MKKEVVMKATGAGFAPLEDLIWFQGDLKNLSDESYEKLKKQILELGFSEPVTVWEDGGKLKLLNGHQRVATLRKMQEEGYRVPYVPYSIVEAENEEEAKRKVLSLTSTFGEITPLGLAHFIQDTTIDLPELKADFQLAGVDIDDLPELKEVEVREHTRNLTGKLEDDSDDEINEVGKLVHQLETFVKPGELWKLGNHLLLCGDSTSQKAIDRLLKLSKVDMIYTDPPYGIEEPTDRSSRQKGPTTKAKAKSTKFQPIIGDESTNTARRAWDLANNLCDTVVFWGGNYFTDFMKPSPCWIAWDKREQENQSNNLSDCELAYVKHPDKKSVRIFRHLWKGMLKASERGEKRVHPTQKPVALAEWVFENFGDPKNVLDMFGGSGSTLIACEKTDRNCFMIEMDPHYCSVIIERWHHLTNKRAELIG